MATQISLVGGGGQHKFWGGMRAVTFANNFPLFHFFLPIMQSVGLPTGRRGGRGEEFSAGWRSCPAWPACRAPRRRPRRCGRWGCGPGSGCGGWPCSGWTPRAPCGSAPQHRDGGGAPNTRHISLFMRFTCSSQSANEKVYSSDY